jgi:hypothetical protein
MRFMYGLCGIICVQSNIAAVQLSSVWSSRTAQVCVVFSDTVQNASAQNTANYALNKNITITQVALADDQRSVRLTVSPLTLGVTYTLTVNNIKDKAGTSIGNNSQANFVSMDHRVGFVYRKGTQFYLDGGEYRFVGFNYANAASNPAIFECYYTTLPDSLMDKMFKDWKSLAGATVMRFTATQKYCNGGTNWDGFDRVMRIANANGIKVIPWLEDNNGYCTAWGNSGTPPWNVPGWIANAWKSDYKYFDPPNQYPLSFPDFVKRIVDRYKNDPAIFGWMLLNEGENTAADLRTFCDTMSALIKSIDPDHLVTAGTQSLGGVGVDNRGDFVSLYSLPNIDFA